MTHSIQTDALVKEYAKVADWKFDSTKQTWQYKGKSQNLPTAYGGINPKEDMAEAVMLYVYDPTRLKKASQDRYDYIRKTLFGQK